jgi:hypothetical protein
VPDTDKIAHRSVSFGTAKVGKGIVFNCIFGCQNEASALNIWQNKTGYEEIIAGHMEIF